jgi:hypothetical protein
MRIPAWGPFEKLIDDLGVPGQPGAFAGNGVDQGEAATGNGRQGWW